MSTSEHQSPLPDDLASPQAKLVYLAIDSVGEATVADLEQLLGLPKLTLLSVLASLSAKGLVRNTENAYVVS
ncbi:MarR family transcriptional regulator [Natrialbaceae archaeon GCM10025810]|uniref:MarR family transcriptional regulator n=1 Tax=Halovalidus salilacus TaxID=3075124 RepID=UPI00360AD3E3